MRTINEDNYELILLDYAENKLSNKERLAVEKFLEAKPELRELIQDWEQLKATPNNLELPNKHILLKQEDKAAKIKYLWLSVAAAACLVLFFTLPKQDKLASYSPRKAIKIEGNEPEANLENPFLALVRKDVVLPEPINKAKNKTKQNTTSIAEPIRFARIEEHSNIEPVNSVRSTNSELALSPAIQHKATNQEINYPTILDALTAKLANSLEITDTKPASLALAFGNKALQNISNGKWKLEEINDPNGTRTVAFTSNKLEIKSTKKISL